MVTIAWAGSAIATIIAGPVPVLAQETQQLAIVKDIYPSVSPDGTKIVFESNRSGPVDQIFILDLQTKEITQLTDTDEENETPVWSPDGMKILFARHVPEDPEPAWDIFEMNADGSNVRNLSQSPGHDGHHHYSPDGQFIVFNSSRQTDLAQLTKEQRDGYQYNYEIYRMNADGGNPKRITVYDEWDTFPSVSPDGSRLLWRRILPEGGIGASGLNSEIMISDITGQNIRNLTNNPYFDGYPSWSPDGRHIAFASNREGKSRSDFNIYVMDVETAMVRRLTETISNVEQVRPTWFPDGKRLAFNRDYPDGKSEIHILKFEDSVAE